MARLKFSIPLENFKILKFFNLWALGLQPQPTTINRKRAEYGSESTVSNTELCEFFGPHQAAGRELSEFLSA